MVMNDEIHDAKTIALVLKAARILGVRLTRVFNGKGNGYEQENTDYRR